MHSPEYIRELANRLELDARDYNQAAAVNMLRDFAAYLKGPAKPGAARVEFDAERIFVGDDRPITVERGGVAYECKEVELFGNVRAQAKDGEAWIDCDSVRIVR